MPDLILGQGPITMSSREIAELVESRHDNVKVTMERLSERGVITFTAMQEKSSGGRPGTVYHVNKRDSFVVVAQLSPEFTARLVDRWQQLEAEKASAPPRDADRPATDGSSLDRGQCDHDGAGGPDRGYARGRAGP